MRLPPLAIAVCALLLAPATGAEEGRKPLAAAASYTAQGLILCKTEQDARAAAQSLDQARVRSVDEIPADDPAFAPLSRMLFMGKCAMFETWLTFKPMATVQDGVTYHVLAADIVMPKGHSRFYLVTDRRLSMTGADPLAIEPAAPPLQP